MPDALLGILVLVLGPAIVVAILVRARRHVSPNDDWGRLAARHPYAGDPLDPGATRATGDGRLHWPDGAWIPVEWRLTGDTLDLALHAPRDLLAHLEDSLVPLILRDPWRWLQRLAIGLRAHALAGLPLGLPLRASLPLDDDAVTIRPDHGHWIRLDLDGRRADLRAPRLAAHLPPVAPPPDPAP